MGQVESKAADIEGILKLNGWENSTSPLPLTGLRLCVYDDVWDGGLENWEREYVEHEGGKSFGVPCFNGVLCISGFLGL